MSNSSSGGSSAQEQDVPSNCSSKTLAFRWPFCRSSSHRCVRLIIKRVAVNHLILRICGSHCTPSRLLSPAIHRWLEPGGCSGMWNVRSPNTQAQPRHSSACTCLSAKTLKVLHVEARPLVIQLMSCRKNLRINAEPTAAQGTHATQHNLPGPRQAQALYRERIPHVIAMLQGLWGAASGHMLQDDCAAKVDLETSPLCAIPTSHHSHTLAQHNWYKYSLFLTTS